MQSWKVVSKTLNVLRSLHIIIVTTAAAALFFLFSALCRLRNYNVRDVFFRNIDCFSFELPVDVELQNI